MRSLLVLAFAIGTMGCGCSQVLGLDDVVAVAPTPDAMQLPDARVGCLASCETNITLACGNTKTECALGCNTTGGAHCAVMAPSNGAGLADLANVVDNSNNNDGGTSDLMVDTGLIFNTDSGLIQTAVGSVPLRSAGEGVLNGIQFRIISNTVAVFAFDDLVVTTNGSIRLNGTRAPILLARHNISIFGEINADGKLSQAGPGGGSGASPAAAPTGCAQASPAGPGGGGAGGGFGTLGGRGGADGGGSIGPCTLPLQNVLQGGSGGGLGQATSLAISFNRFAPTDRYNGGGGGGGVQLSAFESILLAGSIHANGGGGSGVAGDAGLPGSGERGGSGGGSGGGFLIESPLITLRANSAAIVTNGGAGGGGGVDAPDGEPGGQVAPARGGRSPVSSDGGNGGTGLVLATSGRTSSTAPLTGGGGGGGVGKIELRAAYPVGLVGVMLSPAPLQSVLTGQ